MRAAEVIRNASSPIILAGNGAVRVGAAPALREFSEATGIPVAETFMGKGLVDSRGDNALGAVGLQAGDYDMAGFDEADVVIADRLRPGRALTRPLELRAATSTSSTSTPCPSRSTSTSSPRSTWWATSRASSPASPTSAPASARAAAPRACATW